MMQPENWIECRNTRRSHVAWRELDVDVVVHRLDITDSSGAIAKLRRGDLSEALILREYGEKLASLRREVAAESRVDANLIAAVFVGAAADGPIVLLADLRSTTFASTNWAALEIVSIAISILECDLRFR
jgi:hypothetical protein